MARTLSAGAIALVLICSLSIQSAHAGELEGTVLDQSGKPAPNAVVAANPWSVQLDAAGHVVRHIVHSDAQGHFLLKDLPAGPYGLTASGFEQGTAFLGNLKIEETGTPGKQVLQLAGPVILIEGRLHASTGALPPGVMVGAFAPMGEPGTVYIGEIRGEHYRIAIPPGQFALGARAPDWASGPLLKLFRATGQTQVIDLKLLPNHGSNPALAREIIAMNDEDQRVRQEWIATKDAAHEKEVAKVNAKNLARAQEIFRQYGWPDAGLIGFEADDDFWILVQHGTPEFIKQCLPGMQAAAERGDLAWSSVVLSIDRDRVNDGRKQLYGSQTESVEPGKVVLAPIEDEAHVDERRARVGLGTIAEYKDTLLKLYYPN